MNAINRLSPIQSMVVSTYQAVSGAGHEGITELEEQMREVIDRKPATTKVFPTQIAYKRHSVDRKHTGQWLYIRRNENSK